MYRNGDDSFWFCISKLFWFRNNLAFRRFRRTCQLRTRKFECCFVSVRRVVYRGFDDRRTLTGFVDSGVSIPFSVSGCCMSESRSYGGTARKYNITRQTVKRRRATLKIWKNREKPLSFRGYCKSEYFYV